jgi:hypothetical protein
MFKSVVALKINGTTTILVETFSSLNHYRKVGKWSFEMLHTIVVCLDNKPYGRRYDIRFIWNTMKFILKIREICWAFNKNVKEDYLETNAFKPKQIFISLKNMICLFPILACILQWLFIGFIGRSSMMH